MKSTEVIFLDQHIEERHFVAGMTVATVKQRLRETLNIPYFADAIVNGEVVLVEYVLHDGDRLQFQKRFGVKGVDDRPIEEREAEGLIHAYELGEIVSAVKRRKLPKNESIDLMAVMVGQWAARNFGQPDAEARNTLAEIVKRLASIEAQLGIGNQDDSQNSIRSTIQIREQPRLRVIEAESIVVIGNEHHVMDARYVAVIASLLDANGAWLSGAEISKQKKCLDFFDRLDRLIAKLKTEYPKIGKFIEAERGRGFRLILT